MQAESPLISVIVPVYNQGAAIDRTLNSILHQSYPNIEVIIVNDGSVDNSLSICQNYAKIDTRVQLFTIPNGGVVNARRYGALRATGNYISYIDGGDYIDLDTYKILVDRLLHSSCPDILLFAFYYVNDKGLQGSNLYPKGITTPKSLLKHILQTQQYNSIWQYIHKTELLQGIKYDTTLILAEDLYYTSQILCRCNTLDIVDDRVLFYQYDSTSVTNSGVYSARKVESLIKASTLVTDYIIGCNFDDDFSFELEALKLQSYATILLGGRTDLMSNFIDEFNSGFAKYPTINKTGVIKSVRKLVYLYNINRLLYHIMVKYYRYKGKIK